MDQTKLEFIENQELLEPYHAFFFVILKSRLYDFLSVSFAAGSGTLCEDPNNCCEGD